MTYKTQALGGTLYRVTFPDGREVTFVVKEGASLDAQVQEYLNPAPFSEGGPDETTVLLHALKKKTGLTEKDLAAARAELAP